MTIESFHRGNGGIAVMATQAQRINGPVPLDPPLLRALFGNRMFAIDRVEENASV
jgi:hypothetical protein